MQIGVAYYPEQWPQDRWAADAELMCQAGIEVVRVGEFAWSRLEPKRERFEKGWLEEAVATLGGAGLKVIMCTPTAAPPSWLFQRHPAICPQDADGRRWYEGSRRDACLSNPAYQKYARRIVSEVARAFATNPHVVAWQVDNELGCAPGGICYCDECAQAFRQWLSRRYGTIERLNRQWGTVFWSQGYSDWHEVPAPRRTPGGPHPSLALDYRRFVSAQYRSFVEQQRELIEEEGAESVIVTTNLPGGDRVPHINLFTLAGVEDMVALSNYPADESWLGETALGLDFARSLKGASFWVLEQQAGAGLIPGHSSQPRPGQLRLWSYQAAARGAKLISYFRWRTPPFGQEMHWYGMLDCDGIPRRRFEELRRTIKELKERAHLWAGWRPQSDVAVLVDYDSAWALESTPLGMRFDYFSHLRSLYCLLRQKGAQVDFVRAEQALTPYRAVVVPMAFLSTPEIAAQLAAYVRQGGRILVTAPAGYKTPVNTACASLPPGDLAALLGVEVLEHDVLRPGMANAVVMGEGGGRCATAGFCGVLNLKGAKALGAYEAQFYAGSPAVTVRQEGKGEAFYVGALGGPELYSAVLDLVLKAAGVRPCQWSSETTEVVPLTDAAGTGQMFFALNHAGQPVSLPLAGGGRATDVLTGAEHSGQVRLEAHGVALLKLSR